MKAWIVKYILCGIGVNLIIIALTQAPIYIIKAVGVPFARGFDPSDYSISLKVKPSTVSSDLATWGFALIVGAVILLTEVLIAIVRQKQLQSSGRVQASNNFDLQTDEGQVRTERLITSREIWYNALFSFWLWSVLLIVGIGITGILTNIGKLLVSRPRPNFLHQCRPDYTALTGPYVEKCNSCGNAENPGSFWPLCLECPYIYGDVAMDTVCKPEDHDRRYDMWRSFPSGHASYSMFSSVFLAVFLHSQLGQFRFFSVYLIAFRPLVVFAALVFGIYTTFTRVADHKHHVTDVLAGAFLGTVIALVIACNMKPPFSLKTIQVDRRVNSSPNAESRDIEFDVV